MDYSDYTLVSFGDSFTFGDSSHPSNVDMRGKIPLMEYKERCNMHSYPRYLTKAMNFKQDINRGIAGSSNKSTFSEIVSFHQFHKKSNEKYFYTVNLTSVYRDFFLPNVVYKGVTQHDIITTRHLTLGNLFESGQLTSNDTILSHMSKSSWSDIVNYYNSDMTAIHNHILNIIAIQSYLEQNSIPYVMFDGLNDVFEYEHARTTETGKSLYDIIHLDRIEQPESLYVIKEFFDNAKKRENKKYLNMHNLGTSQDKITQSVIEQSFKCDNIWKLVSEYGRHVHGDKEFYTSKKHNDNHWHTTGHNLVANIIERHIRNNYGEIK